MTAQAISEVLPFAVAVAIVPIPIIAVIVILFSRRARVNGPVFLLGWASGLAIAFGLVLVLASAADPSEDTTASDGVSWLRIGLGVLLLLAAARSWRKRPAPGSTPELPGWLAGVDDLVPGKALVLAVLLAAVNPKNLVLVVGAATGVAQLGVSTGDAVAALVVFVVVGSVSVAAPVCYYLFGGERAKVALDEAKGWLAVNNAAVMTVLFVVFGVVLIANALPPLTD
jgi:threonine/homoserine/homoserine lactone efflux protein